MSLRVLLTGSRGFVGGYLISALRVRHPDWTIDSPGRVPEPGAPDSLDVTDAAAVDAWMHERPPQVVVHLAAVAAVTVATRDPRLAWRVNLDGTLNVVLALQAHAPDAHLMLISSAEVYGRSLNRPEPVDEATLLQPVNPYAASKAAADILVRQAGAAGLSTIVMRAFNHTGPGQSELFVAPGFAAQIARIEAGLQSPEIVVGSLDEERDFLDVDDVALAYAEVVDARARLASGAVLNVASGRAVRIGDLLEHLRSMSGVRASVRCDASRLRVAPMPRIVGDASRLRGVVPWLPRKDLHDTLSRLLTYERGRVNNRRF